MCHTSPTDRTFHCQNQQDWCVLILGHRGAAAISHGKHKMMGCFSLVLYPLHPFADDNLPFNQQFRLLDANMLQSREISRASMRVQNKELGRL